MTVPRPEVSRVLRAGLPEHIDLVMTPAGFSRRANSSVYRRSFPDMSQTLTFHAARRAGRPQWHIGARLDVDAPAVRERALGLAGGLTPFRREGLAERPVFSFGIDEVWGIASGSWFVLPEGVPEFLAKVGLHLTSKILPLLAGLSSVAGLAADGVPEGVPRRYFDPLMIAGCRLLVGDRPGARASLAGGYGCGKDGDEWVEQALAMIPC